MQITITKSSLTPSQRKLLALMQAINFGRVENVLVQDGEPFLTDDTRIEREIKLGGQNGQRPEIAAGDFTLKSEQAELFLCIAQMEDGLISRIEVKHGLPFLIRVAERAT